MNYLWGIKLQTCRIVNRRSGEHLQRLLEILQPQPDDGEVSANMATARRKLKKVKKKVGPKAAPEAVNLPDATESAELEVRISSSLWRRVFFAVNELGGRTVLHGVT